MGNLVLSAGDVEFLRTLPNTVFHGRFPLKSDLRQRLLRLQRERLISVMIIDIKTATRGEKVARVTLTDFGAAALAAASGQ